MPPAPALAPTGPARTNDPAPGTPLARAHPDALYTPPRRHSADPLPQGRADPAPQARADLSPHARADLSPHARADLTPHARADLTPHARADFAPHVRADFAPHARADFARVRADIEAGAAVDALIDAEDALVELQTRLRDLRGMRPATAALLFGGAAAWRQALARVGVAAGRQISAVQSLRRAVAATPDFRLDEIARPIAAGTSVQWTGD